ncbi:MAG TPA: ABC transporter ATP-binding protein [Acidimicrobiales bacterium]
MGNRSTGTASGTAASDSAIRVTGLTKTYGDFVALQGIDLEVQRGEVLALLGPNGAGKTTAVEILEGYRTRDSGEVSVLGHDPARRERSLRARVGIVLQECAVDPYLTVVEALTQRAGLYDQPRGVDEVVGLVGLGAKAGSRVKTLSGGQQRRLDLGLALVGDPEVIFLDEPTTGFDPSARREAWEVVRDLCAEGRTVVLTTHYMDEAQALADTVVVLAGGRVVATGPPGTLGGRDRGMSTVRFVLPDGVELSDLPLPGGVEARVRAGFVEFAVPEPTAALHALTRWALDRGEGLSGLAVERPSLEDVYLALTGDPSPGGSSAGDGSGEEAT